MGYREAIVEIDYEAITCLEEFMSISYHDLKYLFENSFSGIMYGLSYSDIRSDFYDAYEQFVVATDFRNYSNLYDIDSYKKYFYKYDGDMAYINVQIMEEENRQRIKKAGGDFRICDGQSSNCNLGGCYKQEIYQKYAVEKGEGIMRIADKLCAKPG